MTGTWLAWLRWLLAERSFPLWEHVEAAFGTVEIISFGFLFGFGVFCMELHRYQDARIFFSLGCMFLAIRLMAIAYKRGGLPKWPLVLLVICLMVLGELYLLNLADGSQADDSARDRHEQVLEARELIRELRDDADKKEIKRRESLIQNLTSESGPVSGAALDKWINDRLRQKGESWIFAPRPKRPMATGKFANISDSRLSEMANDNAKQFRGFLDHEWYPARENEWLKTDDPLTYHELTPEERKELLSRQKADMQRIATEYWVKRGGRDALANLNDIRMAILGRLAPWQKNLPVDIANDKVITDLLSAGNIPDYYANGLMFVPDYLEGLGKRLTEQ